MNTLRFTGIGTSWQLDTAAPLDADTLRQVSEVVERFDATWSRFRPDSLVTTMRRASSGGTFDFPPEGDELFALYDRLHELTDGAVDPLVGADLEALGYDADYSLRPVSPAQAPAGPGRWSRWVRRAGTTLTTDRAVSLDVGAAGKGLLVDLISRLLVHAGHDDFVVDGSGDMRHLGPGPLRVGLEHPHRPDRVIGVADLQNAALCASASNRRRWAPDLHHVIDARTSRPTDDVIATWAVAPTATQADGWATALFFVTPGDDEPDVKWVRMLAAGEVQTSRHFVGEVFS